MTRHPLSTDDHKKDRTAELFLRQPAVFFYEKTCGFPCLPERPGFVENTYLLNQYHGIHLLSTITSEQHYCDITSTALTLALSVTVVKVIFSVPLVTAAGIVKS